MTVELLLPDRITDVPEVQDSSLQKREKIFTKLLNPALRNGKSAVELSIEAVKLSVEAVRLTLKCQRRQVIEGQVEQAAGLQRLGRRLGKKVT